MHAQGGPRLVLRNGEAVVAQPVVFAASSNSVSAAVRADVAVDGGREKVAPAGAPSPSILGWEAADGTWVEGAQLTVADGAPRTWTVYVRPAPDTSTVVRVTELKA